ncbi:MAG TPA: hypothetical protein VMD08_14705, partial [Candidatus Baltobacteraceae bacterium]|nr:hypothetical protein [Candidatus Baltobacteraceae bacterium]
IGTKGPEPRAMAGTPQADSGGGLDPRRTGVRALGSYWGGGGENIDAISGNLNFTIALFSPQTRNGNKTTFALSYNSQIWRQDGGGITLLGQDTGYGLGWKLQAGSITPVWAAGGTIDHYLFTDSSGAEYSLSVNKSPSHVRLMGKGRKERISPIWPETADLVTALIRRQPRKPDEPIFVNRYKSPLTASGFRFRLAWLDSL